MVNGVTLDLSKMEENALGIDIMECLRAGVTDLRLPGATMAGFENERQAGPSSTGVMSVIGPIQVDLFVAAASAIAIKRVELRPSEQVDVETRYVLAQPWRFDGMVDAVRCRRDGLRDERVQLTRIHIPGLPDMYSMIEGCHRAFAARESGDLVMAADVQAAIFCDVSAFCIEGRVLMREMDGKRSPVSPTHAFGSLLAPDDAVLTLDIIYVLQALGIRIFPAQRKARLDMSVGKTVTAASVQQNLV